MNPAPQRDDSDDDLTLSERVAMANAWEQAVRADEDSVVIELDIYPVETESALPSTSFDSGFVARVKRLFGGGKPPTQRSVPRQQL